MKIDTTDIKSQIKLINLVQNYTTLNGKGKEQFGPCPICGGNDRFHATDRWFFCRKCHPQKGDCIEFVRWLRGLDFYSACDWLTNGQISKQETLSTLPKLNKPSSAWQKRAREFTDECQSLLWKPEGQQGLNYLLSRGLTEETILRAGLGFNAIDRHDSAARWGVDDRKSIWLPGPGIVIPWIIDREFWRVNIRLLQPRVVQRLGKKDDLIKYIGPAGWTGANPLYNADKLYFAKPAILVEGEFCAMTINQEAGDLITAVATGSKEASRTAKWITRLFKCSIVLVSFDAEKDKGDKAAQKWINLLPNATRWRPLLKDINDMHKAGLDIRQWIKSKLPQPVEEEIPKEWIERLERGLPIW